MKMTEQPQTRKVTLHLPPDMLQSSMKFSGLGITETVREALRTYNHAQACAALRALRGKIKPLRPYADIKADRE